MHGGDDDNTYYCLFSGNEIKWPLSLYGTPEETCKQEHLLCESETRLIRPLPSVMVCFMCSTQDLQLNVPLEGQTNYCKSILLKETSVTTVTQNHTMLTKNIRG